MDYAVIKIKGNQYRVKEGDEFLVSKLGKDKLEAEVLLVVKGDDVKVGTPFVSGAKVALTVLEGEVKGEKLHISKFKAKSRYRKRVGFRPVYTLVKVDKISS